MRSVCMSERDSEKNFFLINFPEYRINIKLLELKELK